MKIGFESCGAFITAVNDCGGVEIRCNFHLTDCGADEPLDEFITRHGGPDETTEYLKRVYSDATSI